MPVNQVYLGEVSIGAINAGLVACSAAATAAIGASLPELITKVDGLIMAQAGLILVPPNLVVNLATAVSMVAAITLAIAVGAVDAGFQLTACADAIIALELTIATLEAQLAIVADFTALLGTGSIAAWTQEGPANELNSPTTGGILGGPAGETVNVLILATNVPATWTAMQTVFGI